MLLNSMNDEYFFKVQEHKKCPDKYEHLADSYDPMPLKTQDQDTTLVMGYVT